MFLRPKSTNSDCGALSLILVTVHLSVGVTYDLKIGFPDVSAPYYNFLSQFEIMRILIFILNYKVKQEPLDQ